MKAPIWIESPEVIRLHQHLIQQHGGPIGIRDSGLLEPALARLRQLLAYDQKADLIHFAAAYTAGIVRSHPFIDGNKRIGFLVGILFLELNGSRFVAPEENATQAVLDLAAGDMDEPHYAEFLRSNLKKPTR